MRDVSITIKGLTPYSASRPTETTKQKSEGHEEYDMRIWRDKAHFNEAGNVLIPGVCFKLALDEVSSIINEKIKGKGNQTYTGLIRTGVVAMSDMVLPLKKADLKPITIFANLDGKRGGGKRGNRTFPFVASWAGEITFRIFNDDLPEDIFERFFTQAGLLTGVGRGRPGKGCPAGNGRFQPEKFTWTKV